MSEINSTFESEEFHPRFKNINKFHARLELACSVHIGKMLVSSLFFSLLKSNFFSFFFSQVHFGLMLISGSTSLMSRTWSDE